MKVADGCGCLGVGGGSCVAGGACGWNGCCRPGKVRLLLQNEVKSRGFGEKVDDLRQLCE